MQYGAALTITGTIRGTSIEEFYQELGLESLRKRRYLKVNLGRIFSKYFLALAKGILEELIITFPTLVLNITFLEILFFFFINCYRIE